MKNIPNFLSYFRILLIPVFVWLMVNNHGWLAALILALSGVTDMADGYLARRFDWISEWGKILDPLADKMTQLTVCMILVIQMSEYWFFFSILIFKELATLIIGAYLFKNKIKIEGAKWFGKTFTSLFYVSMVTIVLLPAMPDILLVTLLTLTTLCALAAACLYIPEFMKYKQAAKDMKSAS